MKKKALVRDEATVARIKRTERTAKKATVPATKKLVVFAKKNSAAGKVTVREDKSVKAAKRQAKKAIQAEAVSFGTRSIKIEFPDVKSKAKAVVMMPQLPPNHIEYGPYCEIVVPGTDLRSGTVRRGNERIWVRVLTGNNTNGSGVIIQENPRLNQMPVNMKVRWAGGTAQSPARLLGDNEGPQLTRIPAEALPYLAETEFNRSVVKAARRTSVPSR